MTIAMTMSMMRFRRVAQLWNWLPGFRGVAEHEHVHKAAHTLGISPSALSRTVKLLESAIGAALFVRDNNKLVLTALGAELLTITRNMMRQVDDCLAREEARRGGEGPLFIGVTSEIAAVVVARALAAHALGASPFHVLRIDEERAVDELCESSNLICALPDVLVSGSPSLRRITDAGPQVDVGLHREAEQLAFLIAVLDRAGPAQIDPELQPRRWRPRAVQEPAVAAAADRAAGFVAAVVVDEPPARRREMALGASVGSERELELWISIRAARGRGEDDRDEDQSHGAPSSIQRATSSISTSGSGVSGGITSRYGRPVASSPRNWYMSCEYSALNGVT
jgi:DNA-binding transcriptional LysR family regulator